MNVLDRHSIPTWSSNVTVINWRYNATVSSVEGFCPFRLSEFTSKRDIHSLSGISIFFHEVLKYELQTTRLRLSQERKTVSKGLTKFVLLLVHN